MIAPQVKTVADAILYEGYILYPYRKSSLKNQQRWTFGGLFPHDYAARGGGDRSAMKCECLVRGDGETRLAVHLRFLQIATRRIAQQQRIVESLSVGDRSYFPWDEATAREQAIAPAPLRDLHEEFQFSFAGDTASDPILESNGIVAGHILRETQAIAARLSLSAAELAPNVYKISVTIENTTAMAEKLCGKRDLAALLSLASTHLILNVTNGAFVSLTDPPDDLIEASRACANEGCWPVLAGVEGTTDTMLAAPIILYDYPKVAPESGPNLFDSTEIDEILILRILTMTDAEKREMTSGDARAQALLARLESMTPAELNRLHGTWRSVSSSQFPTKPELVSLGHGALTVGDRVRLKPRKGGDVMDIVLAGKLAVVEAIERDFEDRVHVAVVVEDDPGREFGDGRYPGHRFFFAPEEIEPVMGDAA